MIKQRELKRCLGILVVLALALSLMPTSAFAEEVFTPTEFAYIQNVNLGFHCRSDGGSGGHSVDISNYLRDDEVFGQIAENVWLLLKVHEDENTGEITYTVNTDYVCPDCGSSRWVSYSNQSDMLGGKFDGKNMQVNHYGGGGDDPVLNGDLIISVTDKTVQDSVQFQNTYERSIWYIFEQDVWDVFERDVWKIYKRNVWDIYERDVWDILQGKVWDIMQRDIQPYFRPVFIRDLNSFKGTLVSRLQYSGNDAKAAPTDGGAFGNGHTYVSIPADGTSKTILIADSSPNNGKKTPAQYNTPITPNYSYTAQVVGGKLEITFDERFVSASVGGYLAAVGQAKGSGGASAATVSTSMSGSTVNITVKDGGATFSGTGTYTKNGTQTVSFNGYTVALEYNGSGVKSAKITATPASDGSGGGSGNVVSKITDDMFPGNAPKHETVKTGGKLVLDLANAAIADGNYYLYLHFESLSWLQSLDYTFKGWEFAKKEVGEYVQIGEGYKDAVKIGEGATEYAKTGDGATKYKWIGRDSTEYVNTGSYHSDPVPIGSDKTAYELTGREEISRVTTVVTNGKEYSYKVFDAEDNIVANGIIISGTLETVFELPVGSYTVILTGNGKEESRTVLIPAEGFDNASFGEYVYTLEDNVLPDAPPICKTNHDENDDVYNNNPVDDVYISNPIDNKYIDKQLKDVYIDNKIEDEHLDDEQLDPEYKDKILPKLPLCEDCDELDPYHEHARRIN